MKLENFSLIYPDGESKNRHTSGSALPDVDMYTLQELGFLEMFELKSREVSEFFTTCPAVIAYRNATFTDMLNNPSLADTLNRLVPILNDITELRRLEGESGEDTSAYLSSLTEIELYISSVDTLHKGLSEVADNLHGTAFLRLADYVRELAESDYYRELNEKLAELTQRVREIKSVTVGVNLDAQLRPSDAGVLSVNAQPFKSGEVLDKILRLNFKDDEYTCIASLVPFGKKHSDNQKTALSLAFNSAINDVYRSSLRSWKRIIQSYVLENTDFLLELMPEIEFLTRGTQLQRELMRRGCELSAPTVLPAEQKAFVARGLYNPAVALKLPEGEEIVPNDIAFDESADNAMIYVLTGPNRGGKSVITCAIGIAQVMFQLGMFLPAAHIELSVADGIYTHFPTGADDTIDKGRLGEECARLGDIFDTVTSQSLVLLDESLSSTGSFEASYIAAEVLAGFSRVGCRCLFATHLHELAAEIDNINARAAESGGARIDTLVAGIEGEGKRSFIITRAKPDGKSYARDIAEKYGLTYESIIQKITQSK
ncbi:MAG: hypothetical protein E7589_03645 [Ruminococcaceae bacterium]|nr:hypothetical protein [Oscillospiraceae bacterium]